MRNAKSAMATRSNFAVRRLLTCIGTASAWIDSPDKDQVEVTALERRQRRV